MQETGLLVLSKLFLFLFVNSAFLIRTYAQEHPDPVIDSLLKSGIDKIINQHYDQAENIFSALNSQFPEIPLGKIYLAAVEIAKAYDYGLRYQSELIMKYLEEAEEQSETLLENSGSNIWNHYYLALAQGYMAYFEALERDWFSAFDYGIHSVKNFEICIEMDPEFYEAYTATGTYKYWKSRKTEFISWLPFLEDETEEGIKYLEQAAGHSSYNTYLAINSLLWIHIDRKEYHRAVKIAEEALLKYPECRFFKRCLARAYEGINLNKAIGIYYEMLDSYKDILLPNRVREITLLHIIAQQYLKTGDKRKTLEICNTILDSDISVETEELLGDRFERILKLREEVKE